MQIDDPVTEEDNARKRSTEEKEGKEEKVERVEQKKGERKMPYDKTDKFRFDLSNERHCLLMVGMLPVLMDITKHMGVILHGLNTCNAEQFARER